MYSKPPLTPGAAAILHSRKTLPPQAKMMQGMPTPPPPVTIGKPAPISPSGGARPRPASKQKL
jgi:hypothetical protein